MENVGESAIPWMDDDLTKASTSLPEIIEEENAVGTIVIVVISVILSITLLFVMAVFIDCRHQKLAKIKQGQRSPKKILKIPIPRLNRPLNGLSEDQDTFADKMHTEELSPPSPSVIV